MKIPDRELKQDIIDRLGELPVYYPNRAKTQHVIRCQECGDSRDRSHAHLSIHIDVDDDLPMFYKCFRCNDSGIVNRYKLLDWGISLDEDEAASLNIYSKKSQKKHKSKFSDKYEDYFAPTIIPDDILNKLKLAYINARIGTDIGEEEARKLKIVTSLNDFCQANAVKPELDYRMKQYIQSLFVGFLSTNNNRIMFRNTKAILTDKDYRWYNVILNGDNMNPYTFYSIPNAIDLYYTHEIDVHISEGIFDILSIYSNVKNKNIENSFYYASCGSSALNVINFLIDRGINTGLNIHLYADADKSDAFHCNYLLKESQVYQWCNSITIHRNGYEGEKDYGVIKDKIIDTSRRIYTK